MTGDAATLTYRARRALVDGRIGPAEVDVAGGRIVAVRAGADPSGARPGDDGSITHLTRADLVVDVPDAAVLLPACVDAHVHVNEPGRTSWEGFASATRAAAYGGIGTVVDMPLNSVPATVDVAALTAKRDVARDQAHVDVAFWGGAIPGRLGRLEELWDAGVQGFKCFLSDSGVPEFPPLSPAEFDTAMAEVAGFGGLMIVHAEDPGVLGAVPPWSSAAYADFVASRPAQAEVAAVESVLRAVREHGTAAHILHVSSARALAPIAAAKAEGLPVTAETCPHYLVLDAADIPDGATEFKCCPPIRDAGNQRELWDGLRDGVLDCVVSDHSPSTPAEKARGGGDLAQAWGGISGLQVSFPSVADAAAQRGIGLERVSAWMAAGPARVAGLPGKGRIAVGLDADLTWYEPDRSVTIDARRLAHRNQLSAYTGRTCRGSVTRTVVRGRTVFDAGDPAHVRLGGRLMSRGERG